MAILWQSVFITLSSFGFVCTAAGDKTINNMIEGKPDRQVEVPCPGATESAELFILRWYKDDFQLVEWIKELPEPKWFVKDAKTRYSLKDFTLKVIFAKFDDSGQYKCEGLSRNMTDIIIEEQFQVHVRDVPVPPQAPPGVVAVGARAINTSWVHSLQDNNSPILGYVVLVRVESQRNWDNARRIDVLADMNSTRITGLWPYTKYQVSVVAVNAVGESARSQASKVVRTFAAAPSGKPRIVTGYNLSDTAIHISFQPPARHSINGELSGYILMQKPANGGDSKAMAVMNPNITSYNFTDLIPYTPYMISIQAINNAARGSNEGPAAQILVKTDEGIPAKPRITNIPNRTDTMLKVQWERPNPINGRLLGYNIYWSRDNQRWNRTIRTNSRASMMIYIIKNLKPYTPYNLQVDAFTRKGRSPLSDNYPGLTDVKGPSAPVITNLTLNSTNSIRVEWQRPRVYYKQVDNYRVRFRDRQKDAVFREVSVQSNNLQRSTQYIITNLQPNLVYEVQVAGATKSIFFEKLYAGPFSEAKQVELKDDTIWIDPRHRDSFTAGMIAGIVCMIILIILAGVLFVFMRKYVKARYHFIGDPEGNNTVQSPVKLPEVYAVGNHTASVQANNVNSNHVTQTTDLPTLDEHESLHEPIAVKQWAKHVAQLHADGDVGFSQEYDEINRNTRTDLTAQHSAEPDNKNKNRYINIVAYDHSRVLLKPILGRQKHSDYINANYVDGYHKPRAYIAAQGPLPSTFADFWRMVWEQNSVVVVMITNLTERGRRKCDQYWPNEGEMQYGQISVRLLNTYTMAHYTIRVFTLRNLKVRRRGCAERVIIQYHYTDWPDHGVPDYSLPVLSFVRKSAAASGEKAGPIIVHCSAGVGRTGTYIVLDSMMRQIQEKNTVNIYAFLTHIRQQRNHLVQTEDQYIFTHDALLEFIRNGGETEARETQMSQYLNDLISFDRSGVSELEKQYQLVTEFNPKDYQMASSLLPVNITKNRCKNVLPVEETRVRLPAVPGEEGSDYINASYLHGYNKKEEYIVTQHPTTATTEDFWRMVWDQNSMTIVLLSSVDEETDYKKFWPAQGEETRDCGHFKVTCTEETHQLNYVTCDFMLESTQDDYVCTTRMISSSYWPSSCTPVSTAFELIQTVNSWHRENHQEVEGPVIVVDRFGGMEAGTFCALATIYDQLKNESTADVYSVAKLYHLKRPGIMGAQDDYHFLYRAVESICEENLEAAETSSLKMSISHNSTMPMHFSRSASGRLSGNSGRLETTM